MLCVFMTGDCLRSNTHSSCKVEKMKENSMWYIEEVSTWGALLILVHVTYDIWVSGCAAKARATLVRSVWWLSPTSSYAFMICRFSALFQLKQIELRTHRFRRNWVHIYLKVLYGSNISILLWFFLQLDNFNFIRLVIYLVSESKVNTYNL